MPRPYPLQGERDLENETILGQWKGIWTSQSDHSSVKIVTIYHRYLEASHNAGLCLLCDLLTCLHFWPDQSECFTTTTD